MAGFRKNRLSRARKIRRGDWFLGYMTGAKLWVGAFEVEKGPYSDDTRIWASELFPVRFNVRPLVTLSPEQGVSASTLADKLEMMKTSRWSGIRRGAPTEIDKKDALVIFRALKKAEQERVADNVAAGASTGAVASDEDTFLSEALQRLRRMNQRYRSKAAPARRRMATAFNRPSRIRTDLISIVGTACQVCGVTAFPMEGGGSYVEAHHLDELARRNPGNLCTDNVLIVCPACHAKLHHAKKLVKSLPDDSVSLTLAGIQYQVALNTENRLEQIVTPA